MTAFVICDFVVVVTGAAAGVAVEANKDGCHRAFIVVAETGRPLDNNRAAAAVVSDIGIITTCCNINKHVTAKTCWSAKIYIRPMGRTFLGVV